MIRWKADRGLEARMLLTMFLLAILYLAFLAVLVSQGVSNMVIIIIMGGLMLFSIISDRMILTSMGVRIVSRARPRASSNRLRLCAIADLPMPKSRSEQFNAECLRHGRNQKNAVVAVTTGIVQRLNHSELEAVLAHELTHEEQDMMVDHSHIPSSIAQLLVRYLPSWVVEAEAEDAIANLGAAFIVVFIVSRWWVLSFILIQALSSYRVCCRPRCRIITGQPSNLVSALMKISGFKVPTDLRKGGGTGRALFIVPALTRSSLMNLFSTHPTLEARIEALQRIEQSGAI